MDMITKRTELVHRLHRGLCCNNYTETECSNNYRGQNVAMIT